MFSGTIPCGVVCQPARSTSKMMKEEENACATWAKNRFIISVLAVGKIKEVRRPKCAQTAAKT
jgi:hypothetical protein